MPTPVARKSGPEAPAHTSGPSIEPLLAGHLSLDGQRFELRSGGAELPDRHHLGQAEHRAILGGVLLFQKKHVWVADGASPIDALARAAMTN
ncbi:hypothetical protein OK074_6731 [Actinobacteria bacterium OK074]|nr:hypothetical protein OK074_6731 [Actinobacteria bacterium OK074]